MICHVIMSASHDCSLESEVRKRIGCRGRDTNRSAPPAQNRTCAFTHTASTLDKWRQSVPWDKDVRREGAESIDAGLWCKSQSALAFVADSVRERPVSRVFWQKQISTLLFQLN